MKLLLQNIFIACPSIECFWFFVENFFSPPKNRSFCDCPEKFPKFTREKKRANEKKFSTLFSFFSPSNRTLWKLFFSCISHIKRGKRKKMKMQIEKRRKKNYLINLWCIFNRVFVLFIILTYICCCCDESWTAAYILAARALILQKSMCAWRKVFNSWYDKLFVFRFFFVLMMMLKNIRRERRKEYELLCNFD